MSNLTKIATPSNFRTRPALLHVLMMVTIAVLLSFADKAYSVETAGTITELAGGLMVKKSNGVPKIQGIASHVEVGDTVIAPNRTFARIKFLDNTEITLRPGTSLVIERFVFNTANPDNNSAVFILEKGGVNLTSAPNKGTKKTPITLKSVFGELNVTGANAFIAIEAASEKRLAAMRAYMMASTASLNSFSTYVDTPRVRSGVVPLPLLAQNTPGSGGGLAPGLYVHVIDGLIQLSNRGGVQQFAAGQFGFTGSVVQPPVIVPKNPGIQFNPPPAFQASTGPQSTGGNSTKPKTVDCEVR
nr:iron dicitrate transport regulator FecR [uncultured Undibacterium sp.]